MNITRRKGHTLEHHTMKVLDDIVSSCLAALSMNDYTKWCAEYSHLYLIQRVLRDYNAANADYVSHIRDAMADIDAEAY